MLFFNTNLNDIAIKTLTVSGTTDTYSAIYATSTLDKTIIGVLSNTSNYSAVLTTSGSSLYIKFFNTALGALGSGVEVSATIYYI